MSLGDHVVGIDHGVVALSCHLGVFDGVLMIEIVWLVMVCDWWVSE